MRISLPEYIDQVGVVALARKLKTSRQLVGNWSRLENAPRPETAFRLIHVSEGRLSWASIYLPYAEKKLNGHKPRSKDTQLKFKF